MEREEEESEQRQEDRREKEEGRVQRAEWTVRAAEITQMLEDNREGGVWPLRGTSMWLAHAKWH